MSYKKIVGKDFDTSNGRPTFSLSVEGLEGTGKTHFSLLTTPLPVVHVNFSDRDATWFLYNMDEKRRQQTTLYSFQAKDSTGWTRPEGLESLTELSKIAREHLADGKLANGTFVIDSGSSWWEVVQACYVAPEQEKRQAEGGKKAGGLEYMRGNLIVNGVVNWIKNQGAYVILTHRKTQQWDKDGPIPGRYKAQINRKVPYLMEVQLDLYKTCAVCSSEECEAKSHQGRKHMGRLLKFSANTALEGFAWELTPEDQGFSMLYRLYTGSEPFWS